MPAYATAYEIKLEIPDSISTEERKYDVVLRRNAEQASILIDRLCGRNFYATYKVHRYSIDSEDNIFWLPEPLLALATFQMSDDDGETYETLLATDYLLYGGDGLQINELPYRYIQLSDLGDYSVFYEGENALQLTGHWGWHDSYADAWELSGVTVANNPLAAGGTSLTVADADINDAYACYLFQIGQILRIEAEQVEITQINSVANIITIKRARNGTTAAAHVATTPIYIYRPPFLVRRAATIQAIRWFKRSQQGYQDSSISAQTGELAFALSLDPDIEAMLYDGGLRRIVV